MSVGECWAVASLPAPRFRDPLEHVGSGDFVEPVLVIDADGAEVTGLAPLPQGAFRDPRLPRDLLRRTHARLTQVIPEPGNLLILPQPVDVVVSERQVGPGPLALRIEPGG